MGDVYSGSGRWRSDNSAFVGGGSRYSLLNGSKQGSYYANKASYSNGTQSFGSKWDNQSKNDIVRSGFVKNSLFPSNSGLSSSREASSKPFRATNRMSAEEIDKHRVNNLCFYCHKKFSKGHDCPQRYRMELQMIEYAEPEKEDVSVEDLGQEEADVDNSECLQISLHAIHQCQVGSVSLCKREPIMMRKLVNIS